MLSASYKEHILNFKKTVRTSRGEMTQKSTFLLTIYDINHQEITGTGECSILSGLSYDDKTEYQEVLKWLCRDINRPYKELMEELIEWPSIRFGYETAMLDLKNGGKKILFQSRYTRGLEPIPINGLIWMSDYEQMFKQVGEKINEGYKVIKLKIGGIDFNSELALLKHIRETYDKDIVIRLDANGAFTCENVQSRLEALAAYNIHSIEQPIKPGNQARMRDLCVNPPIPIALDEELIGHHRYEEKESLINFIKPAFIILKPSLMGGFAACNDWIKVCKEENTGFWITSALESNIGLNAIAQYTATLDTQDMPQGLGTGALYADNFESNMVIEKGQLWYRRSKSLSSSANVASDSVDE